MVNTLSKLIILYHTVKYLKLVQILYRIKYRLTKPNLNNLGKLASLRLKKSSDFLWKKSCLFPQEEAKFLNQTKNIGTKNIWNHSNIDKLWLYNLHYFNDLISKNWNEKKEIHISLLKRWIDENPIGHGNGWEPYPISLRIVNWIKYAHLNKDSIILIEKSLNEQICYLDQRVEYHLLGNHLFANGKALLIAGLVFSKGRSAIWLEKGRKIIDEQIDEQILSDGGHFELSPMYQSIMIEDILDIIQFISIYGNTTFDDLNSKIKLKVKQMFKWQKTMLHPDNNISFFNDATFGIAPTYSELESFASKLKIKVQNKNDDILDLKESGYIKARSGNYSLIVDAARVGPDYIPGHAHADTLSFEASINNQRVLVNSGTSVYGNNLERKRQRGSKSHNCLILENKDSSQVWGGFRVAKRAEITKRVLKKSAHGLTIEAEHNGYEKIYGMGVHGRTWKLNQTRLEIVDVIKGSKKDVKGEWCFHFHPDVDLLFLGKNKYKFHHVSGKPLGTIEFPLDVDTKISSSTYHPEFNVSIPSKSILCNTIILQNREYSTIINWDK